MTLPRMRSVKTLCLTMLSVLSLGGQCSEKQNTNIDAVLKEGSSDLDKERVLVDKYIKLHDLIGLTDDFNKTIGVSKHIRGRLKQDSCINLRDNEPEALELVFINAPAHDYKCIELFDIKKHYKLLSFHATSSGAIQKILEVGFPREGESIKELEYIYNLAYSVCNYEVLAYLNKKGIMESSLFRHENQVKRVNDSDVLCIYK